MPQRLPFPFSAVLLAYCAFGTRTLAAATVYVGNCAPKGAAQFATIQKAVNTSPAGSTILICPGNYPEQVTITKDLNLIGVQAGTADAAVITSPANGVVQNAFDSYMPPSMPVAAQVLVQKAQNVNIANITVDGSNNRINGCAPDLRGIYYQNASGTLAAVATRNQTLAPGLTGCQSGEGIFVQSGYGSTGNANVTVQGSSVHSFQKNGITGDGSETNLIVQNNFISGQGPTTGAGENGVQISDGAAGKVVGNTIIDNIYSPDTSSDTGDAASGIIIYASQGVTISNNTIGTTQYGIVTVTDSTAAGPNNPKGLADQTTISGNQVLNTLIFDAIDVCSSNNTINGNTIAHAAESGIHLDSRCGSSGINNTVKNNTINEACAGILVGATPNDLDNNNIYNAVNTVVGGNTCPANKSQLAAASATTVSGNARPTPVR